MDEALAAQMRIVEEIETDPDRLAMEQCNVAIYMIDKGEHQAALQVFEAFLLVLISRHPSDHSNQALTLFWIACCQQNLGYLDKALSRQEAALEKARLTQNFDTVESQTHNLGSVLQDLGRIEEALKLYQDALALATKTENPLWKANHLRSIAKLQHLKGDSIEANRLLAESIAIREAIGDLRGVASAVCTQGSWHLIEGDIKAAEEKALEGLHRENDLRGRGYDAKLLLAEVRAAQGNWIEAERLARSSLETNAEEGSWSRRNLLAIAALFQDKVEIARAEFEYSCTESEEWVARCPRNAEALAGKGLACAGLVVLGIDKR
jgi:tetratricopeptide (TPR) repeat protein